ncbi:MAG: hypothetical protein ABEJ98_03195 [Candidatus Nanohaloarchaea archaeon]
MGKIKNWGRMQSKERQTEFYSNVGYDRKTVRYWKNDNTGTIVSVVGKKDDGVPWRWTVFKEEKGGSGDKVLARGYSRDLAWKNKLTKKEAINEAVEWMRNHPMEQDSSSSSTSYDRQY